MSKFPPMPPEVAEAMKYVAPEILSESGVYDLHHAILSKGDVMGLPNEERAKIHNICNLIRHPHELHVSHRFIPTREEAIKELVAREGYENVRDWYLSIQFKNPPFRFPQKGEL